jgi:transcriptional regulator with XRE-family HTH domain
MAVAATQTFGARLKALREAAGFTQEELATIAGLSVHAVSALERGERRKPQFETVRSLSMALELGDETREALLASARGANRADNPDAAAPALPLPLTALVGRDDDVVLLREYLTEGAVRIVTLVGPGGVGKTRLYAWCSCRSRPFTIPSWLRRRSPRRSASATRRRSICPGASRRPATASRRCSCSTTSSRCWRPRRWSPP